MTVHVVKIVYPNNESPWDIGGIFDNPDHAQMLVDWLEGNSMMDGCLFPIEEMERNVAYV